MSSSNQPFALSRATPSDFPAIIASQYLANTSDFVRDVFMGPDTPENRHELAERYAKSAREDYSDYWIKVTELATGRVVAACDWRLYQSALLPKHEPDLGLPSVSFQNPDKVQMVTDVYTNLAKTANRLFTEPYLQLLICFTEPDFQRRGIGALMLDWGCQLADHMFLPMWVDASRMGKLLYKNYGFTDIEGEKSLMRRPAKNEAIYGGRKST